jgi:uncharacterized membrane protein YeaQ/YmgE (transglycosylase-associated protein family)
MKAFRMDFLWILLIGCPIGVIARLLHHGQDRVSLLASMLLGAGGAFLGALTGALLGLYQSTQALGLVACLAGAVAVQWLVRRRPIRPQLQTTANTWERGV